MKNFHYLALIIIVTGCQTPPPLAKDLPITYTNNIYMKCTINDSISGNFMFDTGAYGLVLDSSFNSNSGLRCKTSGAAQANQGVITLQYDTFSYTPEDIQIDNIKRSFGYECDGILGWDFFKHCVLEIDFLKPCFKVHSPGDFIADSSFRRFGLFDKDGFLFIPITTALNDKVTFSGNYVFDTGYMSGVLFAEHTARNYGIDSISNRKLYAKNEAYLSVDNNKSGGFVFRGLALQMNDLIIYKPILERSTGKFGQFDTNFFSGLLGNKVLERFQVVVDFPNKMLYLKPNKRFYEPVPFKTIGFGLLWQLNGEGIVTAVFKDTRADVLGIRAGDTLVEINGISCRELDRNAFKTLAQKTGQKITFGIKRREQIVDYELQVTEELD